VLDEPFSGLDPLGVESLAELLKQIAAMGSPWFFLFVGYILAFVATESPDGAAALLGSFIPPTAPMVMILRIAHGAVPWWQIVLSVGLMVATIYGIVQVAGRIYAGGVLRFGGRVRLKEAWRGAEA
jgi:ABC-2 type transport system permease protein